MGLLTRNSQGRTIDPAEGQNLSNEDLTVIQELLHRQSGIVLTEKKRALVESRLAQRLRVLGLPFFHDYLSYLQADKTGEELVHLIDVISTNVTKFFRESEHFEIVDHLVEKWTGRGAKKLRFWSAACSTGEEPYSLAMTLHPHCLRTGLDLKILATDISTRVLAQAEQGIYPGERLDSVPESLRRKYFTPAGDGEGRFAVAQSLKDLVMFRRLNFTQMPFPIRGVFDVIFCRNAMIYFDKTLRAKMVAEFARLLKPGGYLMVGHSETLIGIEEDYRTVKPSVYQCLNGGEKS